MPVLQEMQRVGLEGRFFAGRFLKSPGALFVERADAEGGVEDGGRLPVHAVIRLRDRVRAEILAHCGEPDVGEA